MPPTVTFNIPKDETLTTGDTLEYVLQYRSTEPAGYAVLFELQHTGSDTTYAYSSTDSVLKGFNTAAVASARYGVTESGLPVVDVGNAGILSDLEKIVGKNHFYFTIYGTNEPYMIIELDENGAVPSTYAKRYRDLVKGTHYPEQVPGTTDTVKYLVILQCAREEYELSYDSGENGTIIPTEYVEYGRPLSFLTLESVNAEANTPHKPANSDQTFLGWQYGEKLIQSADPENNIQGYIPEMPDSTLTVKAAWQGTETAYTVSFWYENADDGNYSYVYSFTIDPEADPKPADKFIKTSGAEISAKDCMKDFASSSYETAWHNY